MKDFLNTFITLTDPRVDRTKRYPLLEIILLVVAGTLSGCDGWKQIKDFGDAKLDWLRKFLPFKEGIPVDDTIARVMRRLDTKEFQQLFIIWMKSISENTNGDIVAIDGKTLRGSHDKKNDVPAVHMVSAWSSANGVVLGQEKTGNKSNEITAIPELLSVLELKGCIVTIDAMGCQKDIASAILKKKADYILALKGNQGNLFEEVKAFFGNKLSSCEDISDAEYFEEKSSGHGRLECRECWAFPVDDKVIPSSKKWSGLSSIVMVKSSRKIKDKETSDVRFFISSLSATAEKSLNAVRKHWSIENSLHWTLDVTFREDESRIRTESSPENFAIMRHIALNIIKNDTSLKASVKRKKLRAALDDVYRETLIRQVI